MNVPEKLILFDGVCNLCNRFVRFIIERDPAGNISFGALQSVAAKSFLKNPGLNAAQINTVVYMKEGRYYYKSSAVLHILRDLGRGWQMIYGFIIIPRFIRDYIYDIIARSRYRIFGKTEECMVPAENLKSRFIE